MIDKETYLKVTEIAPALGFVPCSVDCSHFRAGDCPYKPFELCPRYMECYELAKDLLPDFDKMSLADISRMIEDDALF